MHPLVINGIRWFLRLWLFLAAGSWIVSQWWRAAIVLWRVGVLLTFEGWGIIVPMEGPSQFFIEPAVSYAGDAQLFEHVPNSDPSFMVRGFSIAGVTANVHSGLLTSVQVGLRHFTMALSIVISTVVFEAAVRMHRSGMQDKASEG